MKPPDKWIAVQNLHSQKRLQEAYFLRIEVASSNKYCHIFLRMQAFDEHLSIFNDSEQ